MSSLYFNSIRRSLRSGETETTLARLRAGLNESSCSPNDFTLAGKIAAPHLAAMSGAPHVHFFGQCTTTWLRDAFVAAAWKTRLPVRATESEYDTVLQSLLALPDTSPENRGGHFVFLPWNQRLRFQLAGRRDSLENIVEQELIFWKRVWSLAERRQARIVQIGYDYIGPGPAGIQAGCRYDGDIRLLRKMNDLLRDNLPQDAYFIDLEAVSGEMGRQHFYDSRRYYWTKQPFSDAGVVRLAEQVAHAVRVLRKGAQKVLVLDLDNTLWGGVVGDLGPMDIELGEGPEGEAYRDFQRFCKELSQRGILLAVASKNNENDAREPFEKNPNMILKPDDIVSFHAHWGPKSESMKAIAAELNLGIDSLVFFDDNPAEREEVRQNAPEVAVVDVPKEPWNYIHALECSALFETLFVTDSDKGRTEQYKNENKRRDHESGFTNLDDYLASLEMMAHTDPIDTGNMQRVVQLLGKTNQFNLTTRRHDEATVRRLIGFETAIGLTLELTDKFGEHGLVAVALLVPPGALNGDKRQAVVPEGSLYIDTFLMSCRVINRGVEECFLNSLFEMAEAKGVKSIIGEYVPTAKNTLVRDLFPDAGFMPLHHADDLILYEIHLPTPSLKTFIRVE